MSIEATFVRSAARVADLPGDGLVEVALVGRSNVGKSSLINGLVGRRLARTSAMPGKTRLANIYRVRRGKAPAMYFVDLPGYGFARGDRRELASTVSAFFGGAEAERRKRDGATRVGHLVALLLIDARHPGLASDLAAWRWLAATVERRAIVATKIDKLARGQRIRAMGELESAFEHPVLPASAVTGEGLDELWTLIDRLKSG